MKTAAFRLALVMLTGCALLACDQDGSGTPDGTTDPGTDPTVDAVDDVEPDAVEDPVEDPVPDTSESYSVSGTAARDYATCPPLGDASGTLCLSFRTSCTDEGSEVVAAEIPSISLYMPGSTAPWSVTDVPAGSYQLYAFLDDDTSGCAALTSGDFFSGDMCVAVEVVDADVTGVTVYFNNKQP